MLIKLGVGVSDSRIGIGSNSSVNNSQKIEYREINGTIYMITTSTNNSQSQSTSSVPFLNLEVRDLLFNNAVIRNLRSAIETPSFVKTECGDIYQFEFLVDALSGNIFEQIVLNFYL